VDRTGTRTEIPESWHPGATVASKYEVVSRLGSGGFGTVYKVRHIFRKKYYALKTPHAEFARDPAFRLRFEREIEAMERFVHPDAVMIRDSGVTKTSVPYYTMDFIEGESLKAVMRREGPFPIDRALGIVRRVLRVLDVAHSHKIIHRDIKPDNILLTRANGRETVKVLDFGVAKLLDLVGDTGSLTHGMRVGTPKYMSPEQITGDDVCAHSDLFSLGIVFYELLTGVHPFAQVRDPIRVTAAILNRTPTAPGETRSDIPKPINDHILWMLEKQAGRRPATAKIMIRQLGAIDDGVSRVESLQCLDVFQGVRRSRMTGLVLRQETSVGERRSFLLFDDVCSFGRSNDVRRGIRNNLILRCLPCRSKTQDPENWQRNLTISQKVGEVHADGTSLVIEPTEHAKFGIGIGGVRSRKAARLSSDRFHVSLGDKALELDGLRVLRDVESLDHDLGFLGPSRPSGACVSEKVGYSNPDCLVDHVHLQRASNWPLHEYFLVYRQLRIGSSANVGLRLRCPGVEAVHAVVIHDAGEAFLMALRDTVVVRGDFEEATVAELESADVAGGYVLPPDLLLPLVPGIELILGDAHLWVDAVNDSYFKTV